MFTGQGGQGSKSCQVSQGCRGGQDGQNFGHVSQTYQGSKSYQCVQSQVRV